MVAARAVAGGLSPADLDGIRETLAAGRRPKVMFTETAGQIAGQLGQVVELADPAGGDEFVVVRFGRDELPFSPTDLAIPPRGAARRAEPAGNGRKAAAPAPPPGPELRLTQPPVPAPREQPRPAAAEKPTPTAAEPAAPAAFDQHHVALLPKLVDVTQSRKCLDGALSWAAGKRKERRSRLLGKRGQDKDVERDFASAARLAVLIHFVSPA